MPAAENYVNSWPVSVTGNPATSENCPICGSPETIEVMYKPRMPGLDIPRDTGEFIELPRNKELASLPGRNTVEKVSIKTEHPRNSIKPPDPPSNYKQTTDTPIPLKATISPFVPRAVEEQKSIADEMDALKLMLNSKNSPKEPMSDVEYAKSLEDISGIYDNSDMD